MKEKKVVISGLAFWLGIGVPWIIGVVAMVKYIIVGLF